jgi:hypothetical protein
MKSKSKQGPAPMLALPFQDQLFMTKFVIVTIILTGLSACAVAKTAGSVAVGTGQIVLGAADAVL